MSSLPKSILRGSVWVAYLIAMAVLTPVMAQAQVNVIPTQFVAKMYTEALGRAPDQGGWSTWTGYFYTNGCSLSTLQYVATQFYTRSEFTSDYSDNQSRLLALYRGLLNRDPDLGGFNSWMSDLNNGASWASVVSSFEGSSEFSGEVATICSVTNPDYGFSGAAMPLATTPIVSACTSGQTCFTGTESELQTALNNASSGSTVCIAPAELIMLDAVLNVPAGVTLSTCGNPTPNQYAHMARLARGSSSFGPYTVTVSGGGTLENVWVDGQRNVLGTNSDTTGNFNIETLGGTNTTVSNNRISEPQGATTFESQGAAEGVTCTNLAVQGNLATAYTAIHGFDNSENSDGFSMHCDNTTITGNSIVDVTDVGIILFAYPGTVQNSQITNNTIVSAGNDSNAPICADENTANQYGQPTSFDGTNFTNNLFWTGPNTSFDFGIAAGTREWGWSHPSDSTGGTFTNNWTGSLSANVRAGIAVAGMTNVTITNDGDHPLNTNTINFASGQVAAGCSGGTVVDDSGAGNASGTYPTPVYTGLPDGCLSNTTPGANYSLANSSWTTGTNNGWNWLVDGEGSSSDVYVQSASNAYNDAPYELVMNDPSNSFNVADTQNVAGLTPGTTYTASVWAETAPSNTGGYIMLQDGNGTVLNFTNIPGNVSSWTQYSTSATVDSTGTLTVVLGSNLQSANAWTYFGSASLSLQ